MRNIVKKIAVTKGPATHFRGEKIGGIWSSEGLDCHISVFLPMCTVLVYHRSFVVDINYEALIGVTYLKIQNP